MFISRRLSFSTMKNRMSQPPDASLRLMPIQIISKSDLSSQTELKINKTTFLSLATNFN